MTTQHNAMRTSLCDVERGLYAFHYRSTPPGPAPLADLRVVSGPVTFVTAPGRTSARLARQGQVIVLVAEARGVIEVSLRGGDRGGAGETSFALDLLDRGGDAEAADAEPASGGGEGAGDALLGIEAHVSRLGDVWAAPGDWVAGPDLPLPIEGLTLLAGPRSPGLDVQVRSASGAWSPWVRAGQFAGTRQRAESLTGIRLRLGEAAAPDSAIAAEALFLGGSALRKEGTAIEFTGLDPLVGLKLDVKRGAPASTDPDATAPGRVRVFKARR